MENYNEISITEEDLVNEYYNGEISMDALEGAISRLKKESAPGPDSVFTELLLNASQPLLCKLLFIFNKSWEEGRLPQQWKNANVKF